MGSGQAWRGRSSLRWSQWTHIGVCACGSAEGSTDFLCGGLPLVTLQALSSRFTSSHPDPLDGHSQVLGSHSCLHPHPLSAQFGQESAHTVSMQNKSSFSLPPQTDFGGHPGTLLGTFITGPSGVAGWLVGPHSCSITLSNSSPLKCGDSHVRGAVTPTRPLRNVQVHTWVGLCKSRRATTGSRGLQVPGPARSDLKR